MRNQPFCWQEKKINRLIRSRYEKSQKTKMLLLYATITEMESDFNNRDIKYYTKTIATYSGLSKDFIPKGLKKLEKLKIIKIISEREKGKFKGKRINFTPKLVLERERYKKSVSGKFINRNSYSSEDSNSKEDSRSNQSIKNKKENFSNSKNSEKEDKNLDEEVENVLNFFSSETKKREGFFPKTNEDDHGKVQYFLEASKDPNINCRPYNKEDAKELITFFLDNIRSFEDQYIAISNIFCKEVVDKWRRGNIKELEWRMSKN